MQKDHIWINSSYQNENLIQSMHRTHIHGGLAMSVVGLLASLVLIASFVLTTEIKMEQDTLIFAFSYNKTRAAAPTYHLRDFKSVDVMKMTKDVMRNQQSDSEIQSIVLGIKTNLNPNFIAISIPLDSSEAYPNQKPTPRTAQAFTQKWADTIHNAGMKIIWRGTWSGIEGIYEFPKLAGTKRFPAGTASSAATDGTATWLGKTYKYIIDNPTFFSDGDIWAVMPERTEGIFQDSTSFLSYSSPGIQSNYANFFNNLKTISSSAFGKINKNVITGWTANNFTEVKSTWLYNSVFDTAGIVSIDHYGLDHTVAEMENDLRGIYAAKKKQIFLQEWGDYWNQNLNSTDRNKYLSEMYTMFQKLGDEGILMGFNYWGGWTGSLEGILTKTNSVYSINDRGTILGQFFTNNTQIPLSPPPVVAIVPPPPPPAPTPVPPPPTVTPTPIPPPPAAIRPPPPPPAPTPTPIPPPPAITPPPATIVPPPPAAPKPVVKPPPPPPTTVTPKPSPTPTPTPSSTGGSSGSSGGSAGAGSSGTAKVPLVGDGGLVKFNSSQTVFLVRPDGLYPFDTMNSLETYIRSSKQSLTQVNEQEQSYTVKPTLAKEVLNQASPAPTPNPTATTESKTYATGTLVNDNGTIFLISRTRKIPFTNFSAFRELGYASKPVVKGSTEGYSETEYKVEKTDQQHPWGSWLINNKVIYYSSESGLIGVPSWDVFLQNGGRGEQILQANAADLKVITGSVMKLNDERILE